MLVSKKRRITLTRFGHIRNIEMNASSCSRYNALFSFGKGVEICQTRSTVYIQGFLPRGSVAQSSLRVITALFAQYLIFESCEFPNIFRVSPLH